MISKTAVLAMTSWALTMSPFIASAENGDSTHNHPMKNKFAELNLTADQKEKLKALHKEGMAAAKPLFDQMKAVREKAKAELLKASPSKQVLDDYASQLGDLHKQLVQNLHLQALKAKTILTPEQFSKMVNFQWMGPEQGMTGMHRGKGNYRWDKDSE
jgi:Spy/CpxP family protein refolding chaperone